MATSDANLNLSNSGSQRLRRTAQVIIVGSVMFTFISYWRTAAVVLCDLASTAYYIGGIVERAIGPAAPWFILAVMLFSYAVRSVYIESCSLFVRGGVYRVVKEAMGGFLAKLSVSALMFDYILTGPTSGVSAGQYIMGLCIDTIARMNPPLHAALGLTNDDLTDAVKRWGSVAIACAITLFFWYQNRLGIHESSDKALTIMFWTTAMAVLMLAWCGLTLFLRGPANPLPSAKPDLSPKIEYEVVEVPVDRVTGESYDPPRKVWARDSQGKLKPKIDPGTGQPEPKINEIGMREDPLGFISRLWPGLAEKLRHPANWLTWIGILGFLIAFGHSILAMSGEETLAQVYREVESPKLPNFKKAAFIVFVYSLLLTASISFLAVMLIPNEVRMKDYSDNLIGGLAMYMLGPDWLRLLLNAFVVVVGFLILAGAVNTAIIGSNGVLNRVAEDGVMPDWFLKPHPRYGTTSRLLNLIAFLQLFTIVASRGNMFVLGEAYAFGVVWSFVFKALAMVVLRFKDRSPREFQVPLNIQIGSVEFPIGLCLIFLILLVTATLNFLTKEVATIGGTCFTAAFLTIFMISEHYHEKRLRGKHQHLDQFNQQVTETVNPASLDLHKPYRKLVAIRSPQNLYMLEKTLAETDPETTDVVIMTAKLAPAGDVPATDHELDPFDQKLMTAVVDRAEKAGKQVKPLILPTNNPLFAIIRTAKDIQAQELVMGASNKYTADEQLEQIAFYWINMFDGQPAPLTVRILGRDRDVHLDLGGGSRIPKIGERKARSVADLRAAGIGVDRVLLIHDGTSASNDLFEAVMTLLDPQVALGFVAYAVNGQMPDPQLLTHSQQERAKQLGRALEVYGVGAERGPQIVQLAKKDKYDVIIVPLSEESPGGPGQFLDETTQYILRHAHCRVFLAAVPAIPQEVEIS
jgi:amino acid transporter/nucleotide-binding universal stress UspA family protein